MTTKKKTRKKAAAKKKPANSKAIQEFLSEAQEFVEALSRNLMEIDASLRTGEPDPDQINEVFRGWHTLKGLSATFAVEPLARLAHEEENLLDNIRMGRTLLTPEVLDVLLGGVEAVMRILGIVGDTGDLTAAAAVADVDRLILELEAGSGGGAPVAAILPPEQVETASVISAEILEVLTEFEEHRLKTNLERGRSLYRVRASFALQTIDSELDAIKGRLKPVGEIITYLPSTEGTDPDLLDIDVILALTDSKEALANVLEDIDVELELVVPGRSAIDPGTKVTPARRTEPPPAAVPPVADSADMAGLAAPGEVGALAADDQEAGPEQGLTLRSVSQTVRVDISKLDRLMNVVGELNLIRSAISKISDELRTLVGRRELAIELHRFNRGFERRLGELRVGIHEVRMVPIGQMFERLSRMSRKISREMGKGIHLVVSGADTEVDKLIVEELSDPLMHLIRNAIGHGIEEPEDRLASGKPEVGTVALTAYQKGNHVLIEVEDDGAGIDLERILEVAVARNHVPEELAETMSQRDVVNLIFMPGVTTTPEANELSGRGVGMDVVKTNIVSLGGVIEVQSELGIGTKFTITMPVTLAIIPALLVEVQGDTFAVPLNTVAEAMIVSPADVRSIAGNETMTMRGQTLPLCRLDRFFDRERPGPIPEGSCVVVARLGQRELGLVVDTLLGQQDVVIKPLGASLDDAWCFSGATDVGEQRLSLVLDTAAVIEQFFSAGNSADRLQLAE